MDGEELEEEKEEPHCHLGVVGYVDL